MRVEREKMPRLAALFGEKFLADSVYLFFHCSPL